MSARTKLAALDARIAKLNEERATLALEAANELDTDNVVAGTAITFDYGRAEKRRVVTGIVVARKSQEKGADLIKVQIGVGFDAEFVTISPANVKSIVTVEVTGE